jgi:hypothetical protein
MLCDTCRNKKKATLDHIMGGRFSKKKHKKDERVTQSDRAVVRKYSLMVACLMPRVNISSSDDLPDSIHLDMQTQQHHGLDAALFFCAMMLTPTHAQLELKLQRDKLQQYKKQINTVMQREHEIARQLIKGACPGQRLFYVAECTAS